MAKRRGVGDDINKFVSNVMSPWLGSGPGTPPQVQRGQELARTLVEQADQLGTGGLGRAAMAGPTELAKQALYGATSSAAFGYASGPLLGVAAKGLSPRTRKVIQAALRSDDVYYIHGSPTTGIKRLDPKYELRPDKLVSEPFFDERWPDGVMPETAMTYANPVNLTSDKVGRMDLTSSKLKEAIQEAASYAQGGSLYIVKTPQSNAQDQGFGPLAANVIKEINANRPNAVKAVEQELKRLGFRPQRNPPKPKTVPKNKSGRR